MQMRKFYKNFEIIHAKFDLSVNKGWELNLKGNNNSGLFIVDIVIKIQLL